VLAGYDAPMRRLIESNPGLSSRIKRSIHFEDYSTNELVEIAIRYAEKFGYVMDEDVRSEIENRIRQMERPNARMALSLIDEAIARQSYRLVGQDVSESDFNQLLVVDISTKL